MKLSKRMSLLALGCGIVSLSVFTSCNPQEKKAATTDKTNQTEASSNAGKTVYVDFDSLEAKFNFWTEKKVAFEKKQAGMEAEIERLGNSLQNEAASFQKKAQAGTLSQSEGEAAQKKLGQMQQNFEDKRQSMSAQLLKEQQEFNEDLQNKLEAFLVKFNKDKGYAFILTYSKNGGPILFADPSLDITEDVVNGLNEEIKTTDGKANLEGK